MTCFKCKQVFNDPETLFVHIKQVHKICGRNCLVQCTLCWKKFSCFSTFKSNVLRCYAASEAARDDEDVKNVEVNPALYAYAVDTDICNFETNLRNAALKLACGLSAKMNWPRQDVFTTISEFNNYISEIISCKYTSADSLVYLDPEVFIFNFH